MEPLIVNKHGGVQVRVIVVIVVVVVVVVVVVECYCFLIDIIVEPPDLVPPPFLTTVLHFYHYLHQNCNIPVVKRLPGKSGGIVVVAGFR